MRALSLIFIIKASLLVGGVVKASEVDVQSSLQLLRSNLDNSRSNLQQYRANMEASSANAVEATQAVRKLREQRDQLSNNSKNIDKNKALIDQVREQVEKFEQDEKALLLEEEKQIAELKTVLESLERNQAQRHKNLGVYQAQLEQLEQEKLGWDSQRTALADLHKEIDRKEQQAMEERQKWLDRRQSYRDEAIKWHRQSQIAEQSYTRVKALAD